jgi:hypothetical protein
MTKRKKKKRSEPCDVLNQMAGKLVDNVSSLDKLDETQQSYLMTLAHGIYQVSNFLADVAIVKTKDAVGINRERYLIDALRDVVALDLKENRRVSPGAKKFYGDKIIAIIQDQMNVRNPEILNELNKNINATDDMRHFKRALAVLEIMAEFGIRGKSAGEFLRGAHFVVEDGGAMYDRLSEIDGAEERFSSHFSDTRIEEKGIHCGRIIPEILFLNTFDPKAENKEPKESHFQVESSPWRGKGLGVAKGIIKNPQTLEHIPHSMHYAYKKYKTPEGEHAKNHGAYGWSEHNDANPIVLKQPSLEPSPPEPSPSRAKRQGGL